MKDINFKILVAEDDDGHATLIKKNLRRAGIQNEIIRFRDGHEVVSYFDTERKLPEACLLLLLDINMPKMNGIEVLRYLKSNKSYKRVPVIMLSTTDDPSEIKECYNLGGNVYVVKPLGYAQFMEAVQKVGLFIKVVSIPEIGS